MAGKQSGSLEMMLRNLRRHAGLWMGVFGAVVGGALAAVAAQYGLKLLVDQMTRSPPNHHAVLIRTAVFLGLLALENCCWRLGGWLGSRAVIHLGNCIRIDLFELAGTQPWSFLGSVASGAVGGHIRAGSDAVVAAARTLIWNLAPPCADLIGSIAVLAAIDWRLAAGLVAAVAILTVVLHRVGLRGFPFHQSHHREAAKVAGDLADTLANMALVRTHGALGRERDRLETLSEVEGRAYARSWMFLEGLRAGHDAAFWLVTAGMMSAAVLAWSQGAITTGGVILVSSLSLRILSASRELALSALGLGQQLGVARDAVASLNAATGDPGPVASSDGPCAGVEAGAVTLKGVCYAPDGHRLLFDGMDLSVPKGQRIGIVGPSGAGKSTLLRLIQGQVTPSAGQILLDGNALSAMSETDLVGMFAIVTQEVPLLHRSVAENLWYGRPDAPWHDVLAAAAAAGCDGFVQAMASGYDTIVGERGARLSGGQRQRIAIARALLRDAQVLLLDEATSALDTHAELKIQQGLQGFIEGRTLLAVAHRLSTVMDYDRIIVLQGGRIIEDGLPTVLSHGTGWFAATLRMQRGLQQPTGDAN